jgi:hypothetical protein
MIMNNVEHAGHVMACGLMDGLAVVEVLAVTVPAMFVITRRPVSIAVWLGSVLVRSRVVRAFTV